MLLKEDIKFHLLNKSISFIIDNNKDVSLLVEWFYNPMEQFQMWDLTHLLTIALIIVLYIFIFIYRHRLGAYRKQIRLTIGITIILSRISLDIWYVTTDTWNLQHALPIELCSIASLAVGVMLLTKSRFLFETFYFIGIAGAIQAILTPDLLFGFPQFRFLQFFIDHFLLILGPLLMIWLYDYTITKLSILKAFITINLLALIVFMINLLIDANYMFLIHKPTSASLLDLLGPYPYYLLSLEVIALIIFSILYLPFIKKESSDKNIT